MTLSIRNDEVERMARDLARRRNVTVTEAIRKSLARDLAVDPPAHSVRTSDDSQARLAAMEKVVRQFSALPDLTTLTADEILGYDENGLPT